jgi:hypothetical protein
MESKPFEYFAQSMILIFVYALLVFAGAREWLTYIPLAIIFAIGIENILFRLDKINKRLGGD